MTASESGQPDTRTTAVEGPTDPRHHALQRTLAATVDGSHVFGVVVSMASADGSFQFTGAAGDLDPRSQFYAASTTKLFITALIMRARRTALLTLDDSVAAYFPSNVLNGLCVVQGVDHTPRITIRHLLAHTSGLPSYFQDAHSDGRRLIDAITAGDDRAWSFDHVLESVKGMTPRFPPGKRRAHYSDTNYQLLGRIVERVYGGPLESIVQTAICQPLDLRHTYLYTSPDDGRPVPIYFKGSPLLVPRAMASFGADGGLVSTSRDLLRFITAFFTGELFPLGDLDDMRRWNRIMFPLESGVGLMRFKLPRWLSPFKTQPELLGHSGLSGAFAFTVPSRQMSLAGTVNQIHRPDTSFRLMLRLLGQV